MQSKHQHSRSKTFRRWFTQIPQGGDGKKFSSSTSRFYLDQRAAKEEQETGPDQSARNVLVAVAASLQSRFRSALRFGRLAGPLLLATGALFCWLSPVALSAVAAITYVQCNYATPQTAQTTVTVPFTAAQTAGDLDVVVVGWNDSAAAVSTVTDKSGNVYTRAAGPTAVSGSLSQSIYYAKKIASAAAGANAVTVTFSTSAAYPDIRILEYSGADPSNPVDVTAAASGSSTTSKSAAATTTNATDLIFGANIVSTSTTGAGSGFTKRLLTSPDGDIAEDKMATATGSYSVTAPLSSSGPWVAQMVAFRTPSASVQPPTTPSSFTATAASTSQINLSWTASTSSVGMANYIVQRCQGAGCSSFAQIATPTTTTYSDTGLVSNASYSYRVQAKDTAGNLSGYSSVASATTQAATASTITYVQGNYSTPQAPQTTVAVPFTAAQTAGDLNVVVVGWNDTTASVSAVTDNSGNVYTLAVGPTAFSGYLSQSIYYAKSIVSAAAGANAVTVTFSTAATSPDIRILEYRGASPSNPVDVVAAASGSSTTSSSGSATTTSTTDLIFGANMVETSTTGAGSGFTQRLLTSPDGDIAEDQTVTSAGSYSATVPLTSSGPWVMQMVAFHSGSGVVASTQLLSASPSSLSFGNVTLGSTSTLPVVVANVGTSSVIISQATLTGVGFSVSGPTMPFTLAAGQNTTFSITFNPTAAGSIAGTLSVASNATNSPNVASLSAMGVNQHSVALTWVASTSSNITGYNVYRATVSGGPYTELNASLLTATSYTDATAQAGETYYYVTTAVTSQSVQSGDSNQATAIVPTP
jgi:fibronectin type 3 domain-containing protein